MDTRFATTPNRRWLGFELSVLRRLRCSKCVRLALLPRFLLMPLRLRYN